MAIARQGKAKLRQRSPAVVVVVVHIVAEAWQYKRTLLLAVRGTRGSAPSSFVPFALLLYAASIKKKRRGLIDCIALLSLKQLFLLTFRPCPFY